MTTSPFVIIDRPVITERANILGENKNSPQFVFKVAISANKIEIKKAIEEIFNVKVKSVNSMRVKGKLKRQGRFVGKRSDWKKVFITLYPGQEMKVLQ